jgi:hypothetical protein
MTSAEDDGLSDQAVEAQCDVCSDYGAGATTVVALAREVRASRQRNGTWTRDRAPIGSYTSASFVERNLPRDQRQAMLVSWAERAFGRVEATSVPQRGLRLLEEAIEAFQACGGDEAIAHKLVSFVFGRPPGTVGQELGGVAVTVLLLAAAAGLSADECWQGELSATELLGLVRHLAAWFADDPTETIRQIEASATRVQAELEGWNSRARAVEEYPLYDDLTRPDPRARRSARQLPRAARGDRQVRRAPADHHPRRRSGLECRPR